MAFTDSISIDNLSMHAITVPVACQKMTIREQASDVSPVAYSIAAPFSSNTAFPKYPGETTEFGASGKNLLQPNQIVGYIQSSSGTVTFDRICEP